MADTNSSRFSIASFGVAAVAIGIGAATGLAVVPVVGSYVGILVGGLVAGLAREDRPLLEAGTAAVLADVGILLVATSVGNGVVTALRALGSVGPTTLLVTAALSFAVGAFGAHFGDDLREGLTAPVEDATPRPTAVGSVGTHSTSTESSDAEPVADDPGDRRSAAPGPAESRSGAAGADDSRAAVPDADDRSGTDESEDLELERED